MLEKLHIFHSPNEISGLYDHLFGGILLTKGLPWVAQIILVVSLTLACFLIVWMNQNKTHSTFASLSSRLLSSVAFVAMFGLLIDPWDELFINLQHSFHLASSGEFSFSLLRPVDGTADFLPYWILGLIAKTGMGLPEMAFLSSLFGGLLCCYWGADILVKLGVPSAKEWAFVTLSVFAPLVLNSSTGFTATLVTAALLFTIRELFLAPKSKLAYIALALLPLFRFEYVWCVLILIAVKCLLEKRRPHLVECLSLIPFILYLVWRVRYYGHLLPLPVQYKSTFGGPFSAFRFYLTLGIRNLFSDMVSGLALPCSAFFFLVTHKQKSKGKTFFTLTLMGLFVFILPYYLSGGDWFPTAWGRYLLPLSVWAFLAFLFSLTQIKLESSKFPLIGFGAVVLLFHLFLQFGSYARLYVTVFSPRKTLGDLEYHTDRRTNYRPHYLSQLGNHLGRTTDKDVVIASSEISSIMYYARRETLDTLGLTNPEIISQPLRTPSTIIRRIPKDNELPYLIFKRVNTKLLETHQPQILYAFDFMFKVLLNDTPFQEIDKSTLKKGISRWEERFRGLIGPLYDGIERILELGYEPILVLYENQFIALYFASKAYLPTHINRLKELGFTDTAL